MSIAATQWAMEQTGLHPLSKLILLYAADFWAGYPGDEESNLVSTEALKTFANCTDRDLLVHGRPLIDCGLAAIFDGGAGLLDIRLRFRDPLLADMAPTGFSIPARSTDPRGEDGPPRQDPKGGVR